MSNTNEEVIQKFIDGLTTGESLNNLSDMIDNIDDIIIEVVDQKWAIEDNMLDPLINQMNITLSSLDKNGVLYKGDYYELKNLEEWGWYEDTGINSGYIEHVDDNTFYVQGDRRSTFPAGKYITVNYLNKKIPRRVESSVLSGSNTYIHLSTNTSDDLWDNPYYDPNDPAKPTCVNPDISKAYCDCYIDTERPYTTTTTSTTTTETVLYEPGVYKLIVDSSDIPYETYGFVFFLNIGTNAGISNLDVSDILDLGDFESLNWKKIYIQESYPFNSGENYFIDVDMWDISNNKAHLYFAPSATNHILSDYFSTYYLYYDINLDDNPRIGSSTTGVTPPEYNYDASKSVYKDENQYAGTWQMSKLWNGYILKESIYTNRSGYISPSEYAEITYNENRQGRITIDDGDSSIILRTSNLAPSWWFYIRFYINQKLSGSAKKYILYWLYWDPDDDRLHWVMNINSKADYISNKKGFEAGLYDLFLIVNNEDVGGYKELYINGVLDKHHEVEDGAIGTAGPTMQLYNSFVDGWTSHLAHGFFNGDATRSFAPMYKNNQDDNLITWERVVV